MNGFGGTGTDHSRQASVSPQGAHYVFTSSANNLVAGDTNGFDDVFLVDTNLSTLVRVSTSVAGVEGDGASHSPYVSGHGAFVVFVSDATNLGPTVDTNNSSDILVKEISTGIVTRISNVPSGAQSNGHSVAPVFSPDSSMIAFYSESSDLVTGDTNGVSDAFVCDFFGFYGPALALVRASSIGTIQANGACWPANIDGSPDISIGGDGFYLRVGFQTSGTSLDPTAVDTNSNWDVYVADIDYSLSPPAVFATALVSVTGGVASNGDCKGPWVTRDALHVAYWAAATNLVAASGDTNGAVDVFRADGSSFFGSGVWTSARVSLNSAGLQATGGGAGVSPIPFRPTMSDDGNLIAFNSTLTNLVGDDTNDKSDIFLHDVQGGGTLRLSLDTNLLDADLGNADNDSYGGSISAAGDRVAFQSDATDLVTGDTNNKKDAFTQQSLPIPLNYFCFGDGTGTACPCNNFGATGHGCANSIFPAGALMSALGQASVSYDTLVLTVHNIGPGTSLRYFQGDAQAGGGAGTVFGDGLRCAGGNVVRLGDHIAVNSMGADGFGFGVAGDPSVSVAGGVSAGLTFYYQVWYRNAQAFCTPDTFNLSNGLIITWVP